MFSCSYDVQIAKKFMKNILYVIEIDQETLTSTTASYSSFAFIEKFSFYEKEKEVLFLNHAVFGIENFRYVIDERENETELNKQNNKKKKTNINNNKNNNNNSYYEITMHLISMGINKFDHLKFSESQLLNISSHNFPKFEMPIINEIIKYNSFTKVIFLQNNAIGLSSALAGNTANNKNLSILVQNLITNTSLIGINLAQNNLGAIGAKLLSEVIALNNRLKWLNISSNQIGDEGASYLAAALQTNKSLKWLELNDNKICAFGIRKISEALIINKFLKKLEIGSNNSTDTGVVCIAQMISENNTLDWLDLSSNKISIAGIKVLFQSLSENKVLRYVNLWDNNATYKEINRIDKLNLIDKEIDY